MTFPNVPDAPGVPAIPRDPASPPAAAPDLLSSDGDTDQVSADGPQWGIFDANGQPVLVGDTTLEMEFRTDRRISDYPVEQGGFASYNKVAVPYDFKTTLAKGGTSAERSDFLSAAAALVNSLDLYSAVTPEAVYLNANAVHYGYRRTSIRGATVLSVDIYMEEVRETAAATFTNTSTVANGTPPPVPIKNAKNPASVSAVNGGPVQATAPTTAQQAAAPLGVQ